MGQSGFPHRSAPSSSISPGNSGVGDARSSRDKILGEPSFWALRLTLVSVTSLLCSNLRPFGFHGIPAAGLGFSAYSGRDPQ